MGVCSLKQETFDNLFWEINAFGRKLSKAVETILKVWLWLVHTGFYIWKRHFIAVSVIPNYCTLWVKLSMCSGNLNKTWKYHQHNAGSVKV